MKIRIDGEVIIVKDWAGMTTYERLGALKIAARIEEVLAKTKRPVPENSRAGSNKVIHLPISVTDLVLGSKGRGE